MKIDIDISSNEDMIRQFELQLHEQYAINNNNKSSSFIALISAFIVTATGYGYTLAKHGDSRIQFMACLALLFVLTFLYVVAVYLGSDQRMEQFIVCKIREKYGNMDDVLPRGYNPFGKCFFKFVQGIYNYLSALFFCFMPLTAVSYLYMVKDNKCSLVISVAILCMMCCFFYKVYRFIKYKKRCINY